MHALQMSSIFIAYGFIEYEDVRDAEVSCVKLWLIQYMKCCTVDERLCFHSY